MRKSSLFTLLFLLTAACGPKDQGQTTPRAGGAGPERPAVVDVAAVKAEITAAMKAQYADIESGSIEKWAAHLSDNVFFFGSAAIEAVAGKQATVQGLHAVFDPVTKAGGKFKVTSKGLNIGVAPNGKVAWVADELGFEIHLGGKVQPVPYRITEVLAKQGAGWVVLVTHWSIGVPNEKAFAMAAGKKWPALAAITDQVAPNAQPVADRFNGTVDNVTAWLASVSDRADAFVFGSAPEEKVPGGATIKKAFGQMVQAYKATTRKNGGAHVGITPCGTVGWVAANVDFSTEVKGTRVTQPYRSLMVYLKEAGAWNLVQVHFSNGLAK